MARARAKAEPKQAQPEQSKQVELRDVHGNLEEVVLLRPGESNLGDVAARNEAFEQAWENHRAVNDLGASRGKAEFFAEWIQSYEARQK